MWYTIKDKSIELHIVAKPNARQTTLLAIDKNGMHITLHAKPHKNAANKELITYLSKLLHVPKSQINLYKGESSKYKKILLPLTENLQGLLNTLRINLKQNP